MSVCACRLSNLDSHFESLCSLSAKSCSCAAADSFRRIGEAGCEEAHVADAAAREHAACDAACEEADAASSGSVEMERTLKLPLPLLEEPEEVGESVTCESCMLDVARIGNGARPS